MLNPPFRPALGHNDLIKDALERVRELMPWDVRDRLERQAAVILLDVREPAEFAAVHMPGAISVPRGVLEQACDWDYADTVPALAAGREREIVVICRSGNRSVFAADVMQRMGFTQVFSLKTGVRGWNDFDQPLVNEAGDAVDADTAERLLASATLRPEQRRPAAKA
ncbi:rhodanese-like domain-containing protein [Leptothrix ochracea]|uniref:rhodanese-like domain-containing protein n=1 Tax=Leptothrix ochracea TaxID=735331 RepID=UPI0034E233BE